MDGLRERRVRPAGLLRDGGNPGGYIEDTDALGETTFFFIAPAKFLGNRSDAYQLSYDVRRSVASGSGGDDVVLVGSGTTIAIDLTHPATTWASRAIALNTSANWCVGSVGGVAASASQISAVLSNLTAVRIRGEYGLGTDIGYLDNVVLSTPEPVSAVLVGAGLAALGIVRRRIRRA